MQDYISACRLPMIRIDGVLLPRLILGHLPFLGESYRGELKDKEYAAHFSEIENTISLMSFVVKEYGITVFAASAYIEDSKLSKLYFQALRETINRTGTNIATIPCLRLPLFIGETPVDDYRRWLTYFQIEKSGCEENELLKKYLTDPILLSRRGWKIKFESALKGHLKPYSSEEINKLSVDYDLLSLELRKVMSFNPILIELGSETDFLAMTGRLDVLSDIIEWLKLNMDKPVAIGVHHAGMTIPLIEEEKIKCSAYITPINKMGALMLPNKHKALEAIKATNKPIIAIKPLAGGRIDPVEAFKFVFKEVKCGSCMIGLASKYEAQKDIEMALQLIE